MKQEKILLVEDDEEIAAALSYALSMENFDVVWAMGVKESIPYIGKTDVSLYLLDVRLPDGTGYDICKKIKTFYDAPVIFLTACDEEANVVMGLDMGADDYIVKPFRVRELVSRIHSVMRRYKKQDVESITDYVFDSVRVSLSDGKVYKNGSEIICQP